MMGDVISNTSGEMDGHHERQSMAIPEFQTNREAVTDGGDIPYMTTKGRNEA